MIRYEAGVFARVLKTTDREREQKTNSRLLKTQKQDACLGIFLNNQLLKVQAERTLGMLQRVVNES